MTIRKLTITLACLLITPSAQANDPVPPDLCAEPIRGVTGEPYTDSVGQTISRFCAPRVNPPVLDQEVCCSIGDMATCTLPDAVGRCTSGMKFWCEHGTMTGTAVECYQDGPSTCSKGLCTTPGNGPVYDVASWVCCAWNPNLECVYVGEGGPDGPDDEDDAIACAGTLTICNWGATNEDGTVSCLG